MLLLGFGVRFGGESGLWKAFLRTIFLDFGQKSERSAGGMSFDEAGCLNRNAKRTAWRSRFWSARTLRPLNWSVKSVARKRARKWGKKCSALRSQVQRSPLPSFVFFQSQCGTFPVLLFPFLQQNKPFFPSLFTFVAGVRQADSPGFLFRFAQLRPTRTHYTHMCVTTNYMRAAHKAAFRFLVFRKFVVSLPQLDFFVI